MQRNCIYRYGDDLYEKNLVIGLVHRAVLDRDTAWLKEYGADFLSHVLPDEIDATQALASTLAGIEQGD